VDFFGVLASPSDMSAIRSAVKELDTPTPQVVIEAMLIEVSTDARSGSGFQLITSLLSSKLNLSLTGGLAGNTATITLPDFKLVASALDGNADFKTIATASIVSQHSQPSKIQRGASVPVLAEAQTSGTGSNAQTSNSVKYIDTGIIIDTLTQITGDTATVSVSVEISDAAQTATGVSGSPTILKSNIATQATVKLGDTLIFGGLKREASQRSKNGLFGLSLSRSASKTNSEVVLLLRLAPVSVPAPTGAG
jgi:type II secretory pathway component GspD/PulD (secretin)